MKKNLTSFRWIRKNIKRVTKIDEYCFMFKTRDYKVELIDGDIIYVRVNSIYGERFASIIDADRNIIKEWSNYPFRYQSRRLARILW